MIKVGLVPKFLAVTPNGKYLLVSNWCSYDLSVVDIASHKEVARIPIGPYPRGLAVSPDSKTAYIAVMGQRRRRQDQPGDTQAGRQLRGRRRIRATWSSPLTAATCTRRSMRPARWSRSICARGTGDRHVHTGERTGHWPSRPTVAVLYVVNYDSDTVTKLRASNLQVLQNFPTGVHPIGITYDAITGNVWVAVYSGQILVLADRKPS